jgi:hypothetical protein
MWIETIIWYNSSVLTILSSNFIVGCGLKTSSNNRDVGESNTFIQLLSWMWIETVPMSVPGTTTVPFIQPTSWMWIETTTPSQLDENQSNFHPA